MDDNAKQVSSYQLDQEILDARGIDMTVEEVAGLPTCKYTERVQSLHLTEDDLVFLKGLRRRIKNRLASQNSRRRSMEHLRRLARELRAVRACRDDAITERRALTQRRDAARARCQRLRDYLAQILQDRSDNTEVPEFDPKRIPESHPPKEMPIKKVIVTETKTPLLAECFLEKKLENKNTFECSLEKLVQQSVNHIYKEDRKKIFAKTVFLNEKFHTSNVKSVVLSQELGDDLGMEEEGVLNLSVKQERRKSHGRKQSAPRRIAYAFMDSNDDGVLDLKIKKETQ